MQVRPDGKITLPLVGDLEATGRTPIELRDTIATSLKEYITNPVVTVIVVEALASQGRTSMGEVNTSRRRCSCRADATVLQALAMAGGFKEFAEHQEHQDPAEVDCSGVETIAFNYKDVISGDAQPVLPAAGRHGRRSGLRRS